MNISISIIISPNVEGIDDDALDALSSKYSTFTLDSYNEIDRLSIIDPENLLVIDVDNFIINDDLENADEDFKGIIQLIRNYYPNITILSYASTKYKQLALSLQEANYIHELLFKPFNLAVLLTKLDDSRKMLQLQRQLANTQARLDRNIKSFYRFFSTVSHKMRSPINSTAGFLQLLQNSNMTIKQQEYIANMQANNNDMLYIANILEDTSKLNLLEAIVENTDFNLSNLLTNVANICGLKAFDKNIEITFKIQPGTPQYLNGPIVLMEQVLINMTDSLVRCSSHGSMTFLAKQESKSTTNDSVLLGVRILSECLDTNDAHLMNISRILNDMVSDDDIKDYDDDYNLHTSKKICTMLKNNLSFSYMDNDTVAIDLTFHCKTFSHKEMELYKVPEKIRGMKVAIVDSNIISRDMLNMMLENMSFRVTCIADGDEAISEIENPVDEPYKLVVISQSASDFSMISVLKRLQNSFSIKDKPKIIITSAYTHEQIYRDLDNLSIDGFLAKPIIADVLFEMICNIFQSEEEEAKKSLQNLTLTKDDDSNKDIVAEELGVLEGINQNSGLLRVNSNLEIYRIILLKFYNTNQDTMARIRDAFAHEKIDDVKRILQNTKDLASNIGASSLSQSIEDILCFIEADKMLYALSALDNLEKEFNIVLNSIKTLDRRKNYREKIISNEDHILINELINLEIMLREENYAIDDLVASISKQLEGTNQKSIFDVVVMYIKNGNPSKAIDLLLAIKKSIQDAM